MGASLEVKNRGVDGGTSAVAGTLSLGRAKLELPNRVPTSSELSAARTMKEREALQGQDLFVVCRLMGPDKLNEVVKEEEVLKKFAASVATDAKASDAKARALFFVMRGGAAPGNADQLRTLLDVQWLLEMDLILVPPTSPAPDDVLQDYAEAKRWLRTRGDKPLVPVVPPQEREEEARKLIQGLTDRGAPGVAIDLQGGFPYFTLKAVEAVKRKSPELWIHAFQAPPKARFGGQRLHLGWGMTLPLFGIDSFSRWVVPPPPVPVTREKINFWDPADWGVFRLPEYQSEYGGKLHCKCLFCKDARDVDAFLEGDARMLLAKAKTHDHFAQRAELEKAQERIREGKFGEYISRRRFAKSFYQAVSRRPEE